MLKHALGIVTPCPSMAATPPRQEDCHLLHWLRVLVARQIGLLNKETDGNVAGDINNYFACANLIFVINKICCLL